MNYKTTFSAQFWAKLCFAGGFFLCATSADAQKFFDSASSGTTWQQGVLTNWGTVSGGPYNTAQWASYNDGVMEGTGAAITLSGGVDINNLTFTANGYSLSGGGISFGSPGGGPSVTVGTGMTATISNALSRAGGGAYFRKLGAGTLVLNGTTTMTAGGTYGIDVNQGLLELSGGSLNMTNAGNVYVGNLASNTGTLTVSGGTLTLGTRELLVGQNGTAHGVLNQTGGTISTGASGATYLGNFGTSAVNFSGGAFTSTRGMIITVRGNSTLTVAGTADVQMTSLQLFHSAGVTGTGKTATVALNGGSLTVTGISDAAPTGNTSTFNFNGGTLKAGATNGSFMTGLDTANVQSGGAVIDSNNFNITIGQALLAGSPSGGLTKNGAGTLTLTGANTYTGNTVVNTGTLQVGGGGATGSIDGTSAASIAGGATLEFFRNDAADLAIANAVSGTGALSFRGTGVINQSRYGLTSNNSGFGGTVSVTSARLNIDNVNDIGAAPVTVNNGGQVFLTGGGTYTNTFNITGNGWSENAGVLGALRFGGATISGGITLSGNSRITAHSSGDTGTITGVITDGANTYNLEKTGAGTITLTNSNTYDGTTTISGGVLQINQNSSISTNTIFLNSGTLRAGNGSRTLANAIVANASTTSGLDSPTNNNLTLNGNITGSGNINKIGAFSVFLGGDNSGYSGTLNNQQSNFFFNTLNSGSAAAAWVSNGGNILGSGTGLSGVSGTIHLGSLAGTSGVLVNESPNSTRTYQIGALNTDTLYAGAINNNVAAANAITAVTKVGTGTLTLTGNNTFTGGLTINNGAVRVGNNGTTGTLGNGTITNNGKIIYHRTDAVSVGAIAGTGDIAVRSGTVNFNNSLTPANFTANPGSVTNTGANTLTVANSFNQAGNIFAISGGTMALSGANMTVGGNIALTGGTVTLTGVAGSATLPVTIGLQRRFDAAAITGLSDGNPITTWNDTSGNAQHATTAGGTPTYETGELNGLPVVRMATDGNSWFSFPQLSDIRTVFWVMKETAVNNHFLLGDDNNFHFHRGGTNLWDGNTSANIRNGTTRLMGNNVDGTVTPLGTGFRLVSVTTTGNVEASRITNDRNIAGRSWDGDIAEILIFNQALTSAQVQQVEQFLNHKWALGANYDPLSAAGNPFNSGSTLAVNNSTTLDLSNVTDVSLGVATVASGQTLTLTTTASNNYSGQIAGNGGLGKTGAGTVTLSGTNTYTGTTTVNAGTLLVNGTHNNGGLYTVDANATLGGTGRLSNSTIAGAGLVSPGNSPGIFAAVAADPTLGTDYLFEMTAVNDPTWSAAAASLNDVLRLTSSTAPLTSALDGDNTVTVNFAIPLAVGDIIRGGFYTDRNSNFSSLVNGADWQYTFVGGSLPLGASIVMSVTQVGSASFADGTIANGWVTTFEVVPEPSSAVLLSLGLAAMWRTRRRKNVMH